MKTPAGTSRGSPHPTDTQRLQIGPAGDRRLPVPAPTSAPPEPRDDGAGPTAGARSRLAGLLRPLFPEEPAQSTSQGLTALIGLLVALVAAATFAMRLPVGQWDSLLAEDGDTFLQDGLAGP